MNEKIKATRNRKSNPPYECIRCIYTTQHKPSMRRHLYELKNICSGSKNNIELTPEIKEDILVNRKYDLEGHILREKQELKEKELKEKKELKERELKALKESKDKEKSEISKKKRSEYLHFIYLIWPESSIVAEVDIFKIGLTIIKNEINEIIRLKSYGKNSELIMLNQCIDANKMEKEILKVFNENFKIAHGREYFIGDKELMQELIHKILEEEKKSVREAKEELRIVNEVSKNNYEENTSKLIYYDYENLKIKKNV